MIFPHLMLGQILDTDAFLVLPERQHDDLLHPLNIISLHVCIYFIRQESGRLPLIYKTGTTLLLNDKFGLISQLSPLGIKKWPERNSQVGESKTKPDF